LSHRVQKRRLSGTLGSAITTVAGSTVVTGAISTTPAPTRLRRAVLPDCRLWVVRRVTSTRPEVRSVAPLPVRPDRRDPAFGGARPHVSQ
jgi:hypothetical protein